MKLLQVVSSLDPIGGGPAEYIRQTGLELRSRGHAMEVLCLDEPSAPFLTALPFEVHALGPSVGGYRYNRHLVDWLRRYARRYDAVIVNGLWQYHSYGVWRALRRTGIPYFLYPHGMLDPWFRRRYPLKHLKKWLYWPWADYRVVRDAAAVLFTCEEERLSARRSFWLYRAREVVAAFGTSRPQVDGPSVRESFLDAFPALRGKRLLLFLGRIQQKKGCDLLIEAFCESFEPDPDIQLVMAGPDSSGWQTELRSLATSRGMADRITWTGMLHGDIKWGAFFASEAFVLPSHQENFGIAVAEALACGKPVLISNKVNIWREVDAAHAGFVEDDSIGGTLQLFARWQALNADQRIAMGQRAEALFDAQFTAKAMVDDLLATIREHGSGRSHAIPRLGAGI